MDAMTGGGQKFALTLPCTRITRVLAIIGIIVFIGGIVYSIAVGDMSALLISCFSLFLIGLCCPDPGQQIVQNMREGIGGVAGSTMPKDIADWHIGRPTWDEKEGEWVSNHLSRFEQDMPMISLEGEGEEWKVSVGGELCHSEDAEGDEKEEGATYTAAEASEKIDELVKDWDDINAQELLFAEHPRHTKFRAMYNFTPPMFHSRFLFSAIGIAFLGLYWVFWAPDMVTKDWPELPLYIALFSLISVPISYMMGRKEMQAWDTVTSIIKFLDAGHNELVGQIRPYYEEPIPVVYVDGYRDKIFTMHDAVYWRWAYRAKECRKETYRDRDGKVRTRTVCGWVNVRSDGGSVPFLLHDGSGGVLVDVRTFDEVEQVPQVLDTSSPGNKGGNDLYRASAGAWVERHEWTASALRLADPVYLMGRVKSLDEEYVPKGTVSDNASRIHQSLLVVGEDAPRREARIAYGNELNQLSARKSVFTRYGPAVLMTLVALLVF